VKILFHFINIKSIIIIKYLQGRGVVQVKKKEIFLFWGILPEIEVNY